MRRPPSPCRSPVGWSRPLLFAVANNAQRHAASAVPQGHVGPVGLMLRLLRNPRWLAGSTAAVLALLVQAWALSQGGVILVQAVIASTLVWSLALECIVERHRPTATQTVGAAARRRRHQRARARRPARGRRRVPLARPRRRRVGRGRPGRRGSAADVPPPAEGAADGDRHGRRRRRLLRARRGVPARADRGAEPVRPGRLWSSTSPVSRSPRCSATSSSSAASRWLRCGTCCPRWPPRSR